MIKNRWYLWLNGTKVYDIRSLRENFDTAVLTGYFLGGSLMKWLSDLGEYDIVRHLSTIDINGDIGTQLEFSFGVSPDKKAPTDTPAKPLNPPVFNELPVTAENAAKAGITDVPVYTGSFYGVNSSFDNTLANSFNGLISSSFANAAASSFAMYNELVNGFTAASSFGSYSGILSSYSAFVTGQALYLGSFSVGSLGSFRKIFTESMYSFGMLGSFGSFSLGSFTGFFNRLGLGKYGIGSWSYGSFSLGSYRWFTFGKYGASSFTGGNFNLGSYSGLWFGKYGQGSFQYGSGGSFTFPLDMYAESSFITIAPNITITADEFRRTLINLTSCPLNAYGYGINLV